MKKKLTEILNLAGAVLELTTIFLLLIIIIPIGITGIYLLKLYDHLVHNKKRG